MRPEKRRERRMSIVRAARDVFLRYGYRKTALEDVAQAADLGKATLYHYFEGKDDLFGAVIEQMYDEYILRQRAGMNAEPSGAGKLRCYAQQLLDDHEVMVNSVHGSGRVDEEFPARVHGHLRRLRQGELELLEEVLIRGVETGEFRSMNTRRVSLLLLGSLRSMIIEATNRSTPDENIVSDFMKILFYGLLDHTDGKELK